MNNENLTEKVKRKEFQVFEKFYGKFADSFIQESDYSLKRVSIANSPNPELLNSLSLEKNLQNLAVFGR